jgi:hypothetical protein
MSEIDLDKPLDIEENDNKLTELEKCEIFNEIELLLNTTPPSASVKFDIHYNEMSEDELLKVIEELNNFNEIVDLDNEAVELKPKFYNPKVKAAIEKYRKSHQEKFNECMRKYRAKNRETYNAKMLEKYHTKKQNPEWIAARNLNIKVKREAKIQLLIDSGEYVVPKRGRPPKVKI